MFDKTGEDDERQWRSSIYLEDGVDEWECDERQFELSERGLCFNSRLQFPIGTQLAVTLSFYEPGALPRTRAEGIVVDCEETAPRCFRVTLMFLELGEEARRQLRRIATEPDETLSGPRWAEENLR